MRQHTIETAFKRWLIKTGSIWPNNLERRALSTAYRAGYREAQRRCLDAKLAESARRSIPCR